MLDTQEINVNLHNVMESIQLILWFVLEEEHVDQSIIALVTQAILEINVNSLNVIQRIQQIHLFAQVTEAVLL
jgi:hypothetical protein